MNVVHKNVLVEIPKVSAEQNGVYVPEEEQVKTREGIVIRHGSEVPDDVANQLVSKPTIKYKEYFDGEAVTVDGKDYIVMSYESILLIL